MRYDNAVPITLGILFLGATGVFAATNPQAIYSTQVKVLSVDNTYIANKDFSNWTPKAEITGVTEDKENYYVLYKFSTIDNKDYVWQDVVSDEMIMVSKADLGTYRDLGVYVTQQLKQKIDRELARLKETQEIEKRQISQKMVATAYSGLVGKFLDDITEVLPGYTPVVTPPAEPAPVFTEALPPPPEHPIQPPVVQPPAVQPPQETLPVSTPPETPPSETTPTSSGPTIQILGENPAHIPLNNVYVDLGAVATNDANESIAVSVFLDEEPVERVEIDGSVPGTHLIRYEAFDANGIVSATRTVEIYDPAATAEPVLEPATTTEPVATSTPSAPESSPEIPPADEPSTSPNEPPTNTENSEATPPSSGETGTESAPAPDSSTPQTEPTPAPEPLSEPASEPPPTETLQS